MSVKWLRVLWVVAALAIPAAAPGEVVKLKDESTVRGRLMQVNGDTLVFRSSFGTLRLHRSQIVSIVFDDSAVGLPAAAVTSAKATGGKARVEIVFKDRNLSSKVAIELKKDWDTLIEANHIVTELFVDGHLAYSAVDTTMDKRIYHGHTTVMKNDVQLADFGVDLAAGTHHAQLVVRNAGSVTHRAAFEDDPLEKVLAIDNLELKPGEIYRVHVEMSKGRLKIEQ